MNQWGGDCRGFLNTYKQDFEVTALERFEQISDSGLQASANEDAFAEVVEQDGSEGIGIPWSQKNRSDAYELNTLVL